MGDHTHVFVNAAGACYDRGRPFTESKWANIFYVYGREVDVHGRCSTRRLARLAGISQRSACKAIDYYESGILLPPSIPRGHGRSGVGSLLGWEMEHHAYIYDLYRDNPALPVDGYVEQFYQRYNIVLSKSTIQRWFLTIGPFKGMMRVTSRFHSDCDSWTTVMLLRQYTNFILSLENHTRLVFADEKPMKEADVYRCVRRDPLNGQTPYHTVDSVNSRNRYSILAAVNVKGDNIPPVFSVILEENTDSTIFLRFVRQLLEMGVLQRGDVFVIDNCTIHMYGDNSGTQEYLLHEYGILMIPLPPYHPDLNPTELVFQTLLQRLASLRARYKCWALTGNEIVRETTFIGCIEFVLDSFSRETVLNFYRKLGYGY